MRKRIITVLALSLFGGLLLNGLPAQAAEGKTPAVVTKPATRSANPRSRDRTEFLARYLGLSEEQKKKVKPVLTAETKKIAELRKETKLSAEQRRTKFRTIREETNKGLKKVLTEEQWKKYNNRGKRPVSRPPGSPAPVRPAK